MSDASNSQSVATDRSQPGILGQTIDYAKQHPAVAGVLLYNTLKRKAQK